MISGENVKITIGEIEEEDEREEKGPHTKPAIKDLREWDHKLLARYKPLLCRKSFFSYFCFVAYEVYFFDDCVFYLFFTA